MTRQNSTQSTVFTLSPQQAAVICAIAQGATVADAARQAGIDRSTFYLWLKDPEFEAEFNRVKKEFTDHIRATLHGLADTAVNTVREILNGPDVPVAIRLKAAMTVLQAIGILKAEMLGATDPREISRYRSIRGL